MSYSVRVLDDTAEFTFIFSSPVTITGEDECFLNKVRLRDGVSQASALFVPMYPGSCSETELSSSITATMDSRDFISALQFFTSSQSDYIQNPPNLEGRFLPGYSLLPIGNPLLVSQLIFNTSSPHLLSFEVDLEANKLLLHFD